MSWSTRGRVLAAIPVKPFGAAKQRLAQALSPGQRAEVSRRLADQTIRSLTAAGAEPLVLAADHEVAEWARGRGLRATVDTGNSLNEAARTAIQMAVSIGAGWLICHADLPLISPQPLIPAVTAVRAGRAVIAPSHDGGTSLLGASIPDFAFAYGPSSYHVHLRRLAIFRPLILVHRATALDLDQPSDLAVVGARVGWLAGLVDSLRVP